MDKSQEITACAFIYNDEGKLFVAKRAKTKKFLPDKYELVGGHTEFGETLEESLGREIKEELGVEVLVEKPFYAFTYISNQGFTHTVEVDYFCKLADNKQIICLKPEDHSDFKWITKSEVDNYFDKEDEERLAIIRGFEYLEKGI
jgi:8-oxo-dGTP diphosphatase